MTHLSPSSGNTQAIVIIKAAPQTGQRHGETVCCAGIDLYRNWLRLYPVSFRTLEKAQKFGRWDRINFKWRRPTNDPRPESRRIDQQSIEIIGLLKLSERGKFLAKSVVTSLARERSVGRSLALLKAEIIEFTSTKRSDAELKQEKNASTAFAPSPTCSPSELRRTRHAHIASSTATGPMTGFAKERVGTGR